MANGSKEKEQKDPLLSFNVKQPVVDALERLQHSDGAAPTWSYTCRRALVAGLVALGFPVESIDREPSTAGEEG